MQRAGVPQKCITRYKRDLEKLGRLAEVKKDYCQLTGFRAWYVTTDPNLFPKPQQLNLSSYQYLPMQRIANLMQCAFGINMSVGTVKNMLSQMAAKALPTYGIIQQTLQASTMVGSDETGSKIAGKKG